MRKITINSFILIVFVCFAITIPNKASAWASMSFNMGFGMNNGYSYNSYMPVYGAYPSYGYGNYGYNNNYYYGGMGYAPMYSNYGNYGYNNYGYGNMPNYNNYYSSYCGCW